MKKLILRSNLAPGDMVMLSAAIRDLHRWYPAQFETDVRTRCPEIWENNPYLKPLKEGDPGVQLIECEYPLINECNQTPCHSIQGYMDFLNKRLNLSITATEFRGDIHLSDQEKSWFSQVHEVAGEDIPFWIIVAGGKYDVTIKWWETKRYQQVVDHFRGRIQFVQVGEFGHHHPRLGGVIDLRGQTTLRELIRLVYHAQGVLCPVTAVMHLAAAVEVKGRSHSSRPCVVVAGGREPPHWEAYPDHQFIHRNGTLPCCSKGGCWRDRVLPLGDGEERDQESHLCVNVSGHLPKCMDLIAADEVIRRIELYFQGGLVNYFTETQAKAAKKGVLATRSNCFDRQPLTLQSARLACEDFIQSIPEYPETYRGRGIVICGGGVKYFVNLWVCINMLRRWGCSLPIQVWFLGKEEMDQEMESLLAPLNVECVDALSLKKRFPVRRLGGWESKAYALLYSSFREILLLDAHNVPVVNPEFLFETAPYRETGAIFWPDLGQMKKTQAIWDNCGLKRPDRPEFESGQMVVDKQRCWRALRLALWFNENSDFYYQHLHGDKETFHLAFEKLRKSFSMPHTPIHKLEGTMCQHDFGGKRIFQHRNTDKWNLFLNNRRVNDFWFEEECRSYIKQLQTRWDGRMRRYGPLSCFSKALSQPTIYACMISCPERSAMRERTLQRLMATDWRDRPVHVELDKCKFPSTRERQLHTSFQALLQSIASKADYLLFLEDDLEFNRFFYHNLCAWAPLAERRINLAGLYNPGVSPLACDARNHAMVVAPNSIFGSQAFLISRATARFLVRHWNKVEGLQDIKISRLAGRREEPIFYHVPSLVQHVGAQSVWGGFFHQAVDYDADWKHAL